MPTKLRDFAKEADSIYFATLQEAKIVPASSQRWSEIEGKFVVYKTLKGHSPTGPLTISTPSDDGACGVGMLVSANYVIFKRKDNWGMMACGGSGVLGHFGIIGQWDEDEVAAAVAAANKKKASTAKK